MESEKSYGVKVNIISTMDYEDFKEILEAIKSKGYEIKMMGNGNAVCEKTEIVVVNKDTHRICKQTDIIE